MIIERIQTPYPYSPYRPSQSSTRDVKTETDEAVILEPDEHSTGNDAKRDSSRQKDETSEGDKLPPPEIQGKGERTLNIVA